MRHFLLHSRDTQRPLGGSFKLQKLAIPQLPKKKSSALNWDILVHVPAQQPLYRRRTSFKLHDRDIPQLPKKNTCKIIFVAVQFCTSVQRKEKAESRSPVSCPCTRKRLGSVRSPYSALLRSWLAPSFSCQLLRIRYAIFRIEWHCGK